MHRSSSSASRHHAPVIKSSAINGASVQKLFHQKKQADIKYASNKMERREKAFTPGGTGSGAVAGPSTLPKSGGQMLVSDGDLSQEALLSTASQYAKHFDQGNDGSCFLLRCRKQLHEKAFDHTEKDKIQNAPRTEIEEATEFRKNLYIIRHEQGLQRRRAVDPYLQLTGAQQDLHTVIPNSSCANKMYKEHHGWMINNNSRQQLTHDNVPLMTRVMRGEYYQGTPSRRSVRNNFLELNRKHVRAASAVSKMIPEPHSRDHCHNTEYERAAARTTAWK
jgi:hypothetical protein